MRLSAQKPRGCREGRILSLSRSARPKGALGGRSAQRSRLRPVEPEGRISRQRPSEQTAASGEGRNALTLLLERQRAVWKGNRAEGLVEGRWRRLFPLVVAGVRQGLECSLRRRRLHTNRLLVQGLDVRLAAEEAAAEAAAEAAEEAVEASGDGAAGSLDESRSWPASSC